MHLMYPSFKTAGLNHPHTKSSVLPQRSIHCITDHKLLKKDIKNTSSVQLQMKVL